jgi:hypothetical protein
VSGGSGEIINYRGFEPANVPVPQVAVAGSPPPPTPDLFPGGCPTGPHDRFMAEVRLPGVTVTINAPYAIMGQSGRDFGDYDAEAALEAIARSLRPRQPGE